MANNEATPTRKNGGTGSPIGWYGKLPAAGDFVSRRLPESFVQPWDRWLQQGLARSQELLSDRWQDIYLTFPVWRFVVPPGAVDASGWYGILLPSVDRIGRCFPLTICRALPRRATVQVGLVSIDRELERFTTVALQALDGASIEAFDAALVAIAPEGSEMRNEADDGERTPKTTTPEPTRPEPTMPEPTTPQSTTPETTTPEPGAKLEPTENTPAIEPQETNTTPGHLESPGTPAIPDIGAAPSSPGPMQEASPVDLVFGLVPAPRETWTADGIDFTGGNELGPDIPAAPRPGIALEAFADPSHRGHWSMPVSLERSLVEAAERLVMSRLDQRSLWWLAPSGNSAGTMRLESLPLSVDLLPLLIADD